MVQLGEFRPSIERVYISMAMGAILIAMHSYFFGYVMAWYEVMCQTSVLKLTVMLSADNSARTEWFRDGWMVQGWLRDG